MSNGLPEFNDPLGLASDQSGFNDPLNLAPRTNSYLDPEKPTTLSMPEEELPWYWKSKDALIRDAFESFGSLFGDTESAKNARSFDNVQVSKDTGIPLHMVGEKERIDYAREKGFYADPDKATFIGTMALAPITGAAFSSIAAGYEAAGLYGALSKAGGIAAGFGVFMGLAEAENYLISKATDSEYQFGGGKGLSYLAGDEEGPMTDVLNLTDLVWQAFATKGIMVGADRAASSFAEKYMRDVITEYKGLPDKVYISPEKIREYHGSNPEQFLSKEEIDLLRSIGKTGQEYRDGLKYGWDIEIPAAKLVTIKDKPWVQSLKKFFRATPYENTTLSTDGATVNRHISGLIGEGGELPSAAGISPAAGAAAEANMDPIAQAIDKITRLSDKLGVKINKVDIIDEERVVDWNNQSHRSALEQHGITEEEYNAAIGRGEKFIITGEHELVNQEGGQIGSDLRLFRGHGPKDVYHEFSHAVDEQGGLPNWAGTKEERTAYLEKILNEGGEEAIAEFTRPIDIASGKNVEFNKTEASIRLFSEEKEVDHPEISKAILNGQEVTADLINQWKLQAKKEGVSAPGINAAVKKFTAYNELRENGHYAILTIPQPKSVVFREGVLNTPAVEGVRRNRLDKLYEGVQNNQKGVDIGPLFEGGEGRTAIPKEVRGLQADVFLNIPITLSRLQSEKPSNMKYPVVVTGNPHVDNFKRPHASWDDSIKAVRIKPVLRGNKDVASAVTQAIEYAKEVGAHILITTFRAKQPWVLAKFTDIIPTDPADPAFDTYWVDNPRPRPTDARKVDWTPYVPRNSKVAEAFRANGWDTEKNIYGQGGTWWWPKSRELDPKIKAAIGDTEVEYCDLMHKGCPSCRNCQKLTYPESAGAPIVGVTDEPFCEHGCPQCFVRLGQSGIAGRKGVSIGQNAKQGGFGEKDLGDAYRDTINILQKAVRPADAGLVDYVAKFMSLSTLDKIDAAASLYIDKDITGDEFMTIRREVSEDAGGIMEQVETPAILPNGKENEVLRSIRRVPAEKVEEDDVNTLLEMAARTDEATGLADLGENPAYDAIRRQASEIAMANIQKKIDFKARKEEAAIKRQGRIDLEEHPVKIAMDGIIKSGGINRASLREDYSETTVKSLAKRRVGLVTEAGKHGLDEYAQEYGFESGDDLLNALEDWEGVPAEAAKLSDNFRERFGDMLSEAEKDDFHIQVLQEEEKILARMLKGNAPKPATGLKRFIREETGQIQVDELMVSEYDALKASMKKAEQASRVAFRAGKIDGALAEKTREREIAERLKEKREARLEARQIHKDIIKITKDKKLPLDYRDRINDFLSDYDLLPRSAKGQRRVESTRDFIDRMEAAGEDVDIPRAVLSKIERYGKIPWRELTLDQFRDIGDQVKMLAHLGKLKATLIAKGKERSFEQAVGTVVGEIKANWPSAAEGPDVETMLLDPTLIDKLKENRNKYIAQITKPEYICRRLDGWKELGPVHETIWMPIQEASDNELRGAKSLVESVTALFAPFKEKGGKWLREKYRIPGIPQILTKEKILMVALNNGNEGNRNALMAGYNWTEPQINLIVSQLTPEENVLVRGIFALYQTQFPELARVYQAFTGGRLQAVEGDYHPLVFDRKLSWSADKFAQMEQAKDLFEAIYPSLKTKDSFTKTRTGGLMPPKLSLQVVFSHLMEVNHYVTHAEAVRDVNKILADPRVRAAIEGAPAGIGGPEAYAQMIPWLQDIAKPLREPMTQGEYWIKKMRKNATIVGMGLKFSVAAFNILGSTQSINSLGAGNFLRGLAEFYAHRGDMVEAIKAKSPEMGARADTWDRDLADMYGRLGLENFRGSQMIKDSFFSLITLMDLAVTYPTWQAAYDVGMEQFGGQEHKAIDFANMKVRNSQSSGLVKDLAAIQRGGELQRLVTMYYTFFSSMQNELKEAQLKTGTGSAGKGDLIKSWWWLVIAPALLGYMMTERKVPDSGQAISEILRYRLAGLPIVRDVLGSILSGYDYKFSPAVRAGEVIVKTGQQATKVFNPDEEVDVGKLAKGAFESSGYLFGLPTSQALITMQGLMDLNEGETSDPTRLLFRAPREEEE